MSTVAKIFDRTFLLGFFAPAVVLVALALWILALMDMLPGPLGTELREPLKDTTLFVTISFFVALFFVALNHSLFRFVEGYRPFEWYQALVGAFQRCIYRRRLAAIQEIEERIEELKARGAHPKHEVDSIESEIRRSEAQAAKLHLAMLTRYPAKESRVLPTSFGNAIRAFEDYPQELYAFRGVMGWTRLMGCIDRDFSDSIDAARALVSFWLNLWFAGVLLTATYVVLLLLSPRAQGHWWFATLTLLLSACSYYRARSAAIQWGTWVKAAFDLYLPKLAYKMGYKPPRTIVQQRTFWETLATAIMYHDSDTLQKLDHLRLSDE